MISHSVQGPRLGIPQMIQSRAQFGVLGAIFPMLFVMFIYFGFSVSNTLLAAQTVNGVVAVPRSVSIVVFTILSFAIALYGYKLIHDTQRWLTWIACAIYAVVFVIVLSNPPSLDYWLPVATKPALVFAGIGVTCTFALSFRLMLPTIRATCRAMFPRRRCSGIPSRASPLHSSR
ncbi:hypothetical protein GYH37_23075 [Rhizobium laguerreae]|nr:hypothetical protein [Rhizobium laguerreae]